MEQKGDVGVGAGQVDILGGHGEKAVVPSDGLAEDSVSGSQGEVVDRKVEVHAGEYVKEEIGQDDEGKYVC